MTTLNDIDICSCCGKPLLEDRQGKYCPSEMDWAAHGFEVQVQIDSYGYVALVMGDERIMDELAIREQCR